MTDDISIPKIGKVPKKYVIGAIGIVVAYVGWRYYKANQESSNDVTTVTPDVNNSDVSASGVIGNSSSGNVQYAGTTTNTSNGILTNAQWTDDVVQKLTGTGGWDSASVYSALGDFLTAKPLTNSEQAIVRAAIAASGNPPVGTFNIIATAGDITPAAPTNVKASSITTTSANITWSAVPNAAHYNLYRSDVGNAVIGAASSPSATSATVAGLTPNVSYTVYVAAVSTLGKVGAKSAGVSFKTLPVALKAPNTPTVSKITKTTVLATTGKVAGATGYNWYINGIAHGHSDNPSYTIQGLKANTSYKLSVGADTATQSPSPMSGYRSFKTAK